MNAILQYQCRSCRKTYENETRMHRAKAIALLAQFTISHTPQRSEDAFLSILDIHVHRDGSVGVADLVGIK